MRGSDLQRTISTMEGPTGSKTKKKVVAVVGGGLVRKENESELIHCTVCLVFWSAYWLHIDLYKLSHTEREQLYKARERRGLSFLFIVYFHLKVWNKVLRKFYIVLILYRQEIIVYAWQGFWSDFQRTALTSSPFRLGHWTPASLPKEVLMWNSLKLVKVILKLSF